jgi:PAS domain S-box-containing protein
LFVLTVFHQKIQGMLKQGILSLQRPAVYLTLIYLMAGSLWIQFSDQWVLKLFYEPIILTKVQTYKGWFFILMSGSMLLVLLSMLSGDLRRKEQALTQLRQIHKEFLENHILPVWQSDCTGNCVISNKKWIALTGRPLENQRPFAWLDTICPDDKSGCIETFSQGFISQKGFESIHRIIDRQGDHVWYRCTCVPYQLNGRFGGFLGYYENLQEIRQLERNFLESKKRQGFLFWQNPNPMIVYDVQDLRILEVNQAALQLYGYTEKEFLSMNLIDLRPSSEVPAFMELMSQNLPKFQRSSGWIHKRKDGSLFDAEISGHEMQEKTMRLVLIQDITDKIDTFRRAKECQARFAMIFESMTQGAVVMSKDLAIVDINETACQILHIEKQKAEQVSFSRFFREYDSAALNFAEKMKQDLPFADEMIMLTQEGEEFHARFHSVPFLENGQPRVFFSFENIEEQFRTQIALQQCERINASLTENLPGLVFQCIPDDNWTMKYISKGIEKLSGYTASDLVFNHLLSYSDLIHPADREHVRKQVNQSLIETQQFDITYRIVTRDKEIKWVREQGYEVVDDRENLLCIEGLILDITGQMKAQADADYQVHFLSFIIDCIPFPIYYADTSGIVKGCNGALSDLLVKEKNQITGFQLTDVLNHGDLRSVDEVMGKTNGKYAGDEKILYFPGRQLVLRQYEIADLFKQPAGTLGVFLDASNRTQDQKIIQLHLKDINRLNAELEALFHTVSHDLRSPLVTIKGFLGLLKEDIYEKNVLQAEEDMMRIEAAAEKMQLFLDDLLRVAKIRNTPLRLQKINISSVARDAENLMAPYLKKKKCGVQVVDDMPVVEGDIILIRELLVNLMDNAAKFSSSESAAEISIYQRTHEGYGVYCIEDQGLGIPVAQREKIFNLFYKIDPATQGNGVGLAIAKQIVEKHGGRIWVESKGAHKGSIFCFTLNTENSYK